MGDPGMQQGGVGARAADFPPTAKALQTLVRSWTAVLAGGPLLAVAGVLLMTASGGGRVPTYLIIFGVGVPVAALVWLSYARRMRVALQRGPWAACRAAAVVNGFSSPTVVVQDPVTGELRVFVGRTALWSMDWVDPGPAGVLWWAEHPERGGVVCRPGGSGLVWVKPLKAGRKRDAGLARAAQRGIVQQPAPGAQQQGWGGPPPQQHQQPQPAWGTRPAPQGWGQQPQQHQQPYPQQQPPFPQQQQQQPQQHQPPQQPGWGPPPGSGSW